MRSDAACVCLPFRRDAQPGCQSRGSEPITFPHGARVHGSLSEHQRPFHRCEYGDNLSEGSLLMPTLRQQLRVRKSEQRCHPSTQRARRRRATTHPLKQSKITQKTTTSVKIKRRLAALGPVSLSMSAQRPANFTNLPSLAFCASPPPKKQPRRM